MMANSTIEGQATAEYDGRLEQCPLCAASKLRPFDRDHRGNRIDRCGVCRVKLINPQYSDRDRELLPTRG